MASSASSEPKATTQQVRINSAFESFKHNASIALLVLAPILIAIPPRKLDLYTFSLTGAFVASANQLNVERTGRGLLSQFGYDRRAATLRVVDESGQTRSALAGQKSVPSTASNRVLTQDSDSTDLAGTIEAKAKAVWLGAETEGWKQRRLKEEQEKLDRGEGYGSMIMDQIWEVWNWSERKSDELKKLDEKTVDKAEDK